MSWKGCLCLPLFSSRLWLQVAMELCPKFLLSISVLSIWMSKLELRIIIYPSPQFPSSCYFMGVKYAFQPTIFSSNDGIIRIVLIAYDCRKDKKRQWVHSKMAFGSIDVHCCTDCLVYLLIGKIGPGLSSPRKRIWLSILGSKTSVAWDGMVVF